VRKALIVHGGAGSGKIEKREIKERELGKAVEYGIEAIRSGSVEAVQAAVSYMEDSGVFNAGYGSCLNMLGEIELDAAIMDGSNMRGAGVANCTVNHNAVKVARAVMMYTNHVLVSGKYLELIAERSGLKKEKLTPSNEVLEKFKQMKEKIDDRNSKVYSLLKEFGTVGAVALDDMKIPAAAVSTGGLWMKFPGRIGDSAIIGCGIYADKSKGASCATGIGEEIIRNALSYSLCNLLKFGSEKAAKSAIKMITERSGKNTAGVIAVDLEYRVSYAYNTDFILVAWYDDKRKKVIVPNK
jgi:beta-aspartyl-peptidase (threonine type)